jgi:hypothetical protein
MSEINFNFKKSENMLLQEATWFISADALALVAKTNKF